jgi:glycosyltransferase involved in cell wall biosynthesis
MQIAFLACVYPPYPGGIGVAAAGFARAMHVRGHRVAVFTLASSLPPPSEPFPVYRLRSPLRYGLAAFVPQLLWRLRAFEVVHCLYPFFGAAELLVLLRQTSRARLVLHHIMDAVAPGWLGVAFDWHRRRALYRLVGASDLVLDMSEDFFQGSDFGPLYAKLRRRPPLAFVPLGVDTDRFRPPPARPALPEQPAIIFTGGLDRAHYFKGLPVLLDALAMLRRRGVRCRCLIVGEGDRRAAYEAQARQLGLLGSAATSVVRFTGLVPNEDLPRYYQAADVFVMPSTARVESFSISTGEAQACGLPAIVADFPGVRATIAEGETGFTVRPGDAADLAGKLERLLRDATLRRRLGAAGRQRAIERYDWAAIGKQLERHYAALLRGRQFP